MSLSTLFGGFNNLDQIKIEDVTRWLNPVPQQTFLENYLANKILYPKAVPLSPTEVKIDLAILREALRLSGPANTPDKSDFLGNNPFINTTMRKIIIPAVFLDYTGDLFGLITAFIDGLLWQRLRKDWFEDLWTVVLSDDNEETVGSVILPQFSHPAGLIQLGLEAKTFDFKAGVLGVLPAPKERYNLIFSLKYGKLLGKDKGNVEFSGGKIGLVIDTRIK